MKHRKVPPAATVNPAAAAAAPPPASTMSDEATYATAIAAAISQGMDGATFARLIHIQYPDAVTEIAALTFEGCIERMRADAQAAAILDAVPNFQQWARAFYGECRNLGGLPV